MAKEKTSKEKKPKKETSGSEEPKQPAILTTIMLSQDYDPEHWKWSDDENKVLDQYRFSPDAAKEVGTIILNHLLAHGVEFEEAYAITHDKDEHVIWSEYKNQYITTFTSNHIHFVAKFKKGDTLENLADFIGIDPQYIEKPKSGRYSYDNMLSYLIHIKYPQKYRYNARDVVTLMGQNYFDAHYSEKYKQWMHGRAERIAYESAYTLKDVKMMIMDGKISMKDLLTKPEFKYIFITYKKTLENLMRDYQDYLLLQKKAEEGFFDEDDALIKGSSMSLDGSSDDVPEDDNADLGVALSEN